MFSVDPLESATEAGLRYVSGSGLCILRIHCGKSFRYFGPDGSPLRNPKQLERIRSLAIPPAWTNVRICPSPYGHLQAVGRDARGRKQYRYHPHYREVRDQTKFSRMIAFGAALAAIRRQVRRDLRRSGLPKQKVLATVVRLLETSFIRVGNDEYAKENDSFGLTTMKDRHVRVAGAKLLFHFRAERAVRSTISSDGPASGAHCQAMPGPAGLRAVPVHRRKRGDMRRRFHRGKSIHPRYRRAGFHSQGFPQAGPEPFSPSASCAHADLCRDEKAAKRAVVEAVKCVAKRLGNRPATCRKYYIHPAIPDAFSDGSPLSPMQQGERQHMAYKGLGSRPEEYCVLVVVAAHQERLAREGRSYAA
jgi:DNA topoisomerase-1